MKWIWPINWYWRVRQLEAENELLRAQNRKLDSNLRALAIQQASLAALYSSSMASVVAIRASADEA